MKELAPHKKFEVVPFSISVQECLDKASDNLNIEDVSIGRIFESGTFSCLSKGSSLEIVSNKSGQRRAAYDFNCTDLKQTVTAICQYGKKFIVALKCHNSSQVGIVCIYDPGISRVIKTIHIPNVPASLDLIKEYGGAGEGPTLFNSALKCMFGIVAVGTEDGHVHLVDLRCDDRAEEFPISHPGSLLIIDPAETGNVVELRSKARETHSHCCIDLCYSLCSPKAFKYVGITGQIIKVCSSDNCSVSSLMYLKESYMLIVGFSFGCFQIWSMEHLQLLYSSPVGLYTSPVTHFTFQEPDDDPRHCCFLWVGRGPSQFQNRISGPTSLTLYQLLFEFKELKTGYGPIYKNLECIIRRFDHQLTSDVHHMVDSRSVGSRIITLRTLEQSAVTGQINDDLESKTYSGKDSTVCYVVWETPGTESDVSMSCHLGVFDINRWYEKQLPASIRDAMYGRMEAVCPFFAFYSLTDVAEAFLPNGLLDAYIDVKSLNTFRNIEGPQSEQFYWPSSATFKVTFISESSCIETEMLGIQRQIMAEMRNLGTDSFLDAQELVKSCWVAGLLQNSIDVTKPNGDKRNTDAVLSVSLEHNGIAFITSCIKKWAHGSITHAGHSLKLIYDWAWNQAVQYKKMFDQLHIPMFSSISEKLEEEHVNMLKRLSLELDHLSNVFKELERCKTLTIQEGSNELKTRSNIVSYLSLYGDILLLLVHSGVLPEQPVKYEKSSVNKISYPFKMLANYYDTQKKKLSNMVGKSDGHTCKLFISTLWQEVNQLDEIAQDYPPASIEIMCRIFLENLSNDNVQLSIFYYWVLDVCECYEELQQNEFSKKMKTCLKLKKDNALLIESLWLLDHELYKDAAEHLSLVESKISSFYYHQIVKVLYDRGEISLLTLFCSSKQPDDVYSVEETKFLIRILVDIKMLPNAYSLQHNYCMHSKKTGVFHYFLDQCKDNKVLGKLITLSLSMDEEDSLRSYLESSTQNTDYLLVYYLERGLYSDAAELTKKMKNTTQVDFDRLQQEYRSAKCLLVDGFLQIVPPIQKRKLSLINMKSNTPTNEKKPPLSTVIRKVGNQKEHSTFVRSSFNTLYNNDVTDIYGSKSFFEDSFTTNQRRRKSPLFDGEVVSPTKKQKEMPSPSKTTFKAMSAISDKRKKSLFTGSDAYLLLRTPPVSRTSKIITVNRDNTKTPHSILKSRITSKLHGHKKGTTATSPRRVVSILPTPDISTPSRRIRFVGLVSPTTSPLAAPPDHASSPEASLVITPDHASSPEASLVITDKASPSTKEVTNDQQTLDFSLISNESFEFKSPECDSSHSQSGLDGSFQETIPKVIKSSEEETLEDFLNQVKDSSCLDSSTVDEILNTLSEQDDQVVSDNKDSQVEQPSIISVNTSIEVNIPPDNSDNADNTHEQKIDEMETDEVVASNENDSSKIEISSSSEDMISKNDFVVATSANVDDASKEEVSIDTYVDADEDVVEIIESDSESDAESYSDTDLYGDLDTSMPMDVDEDDGESELNENVGYNSPESEDEDSNISPSSDVVSEFTLNESFQSFAQPLVVEEAVIIENDTLNSEQVPVAEDDGDHQTEQHEHELETEEYTVHVISSQDESDYLDVSTGNKEHALRHEECDTEGHVVENKLEVDEQELENELETKKILLESKLETDEAVLEPELDIEEPTFEPEISIERPLLESKLRLEPELEDEEYFVQSQMESTVVPDTNPYSNPPVNSYYCEALELFSNDGAENTMESTVHEVLRTVAESENSAEVEMPVLYDSILPEDSTYTFASSTMQDEPSLISRLEETMEPSEDETNILPLSTVSSKSDVSVVKKTPQRRKPSRRVVTRSAVKMLVDKTLNESMFDDTAVNASMLNVSSIDASVNQPTRRSRRVKTDLNKDVTLKEDASGMNASDAISDDTTTIKVKRRGRTKKVNLKSEIDDNTIKEASSPVRHTRSHDNEPPSAKASSPVRHARSHDNVSTNVKEAPSPARHTRSKDNQSANVEDAQTPTRRTRSHENGSTNVKEAPSPARHTRSHDNDSTNVKEAPSPARHRKSRDNDSTNVKEAPSPARHTRSHDNDSTNVKGAPSPSRHARSHANESHVTERDNSQPEHYTHLTPAIVAISPLQYAEYVAGECKFRSIQQTELENESTATQHPARHSKLTKIAKIVPEEDKTNTIKSKQRKVVLDKAKATKSNSRRSKLEIRVVPDEEESDSSDQITLPKLVSSTVKQKSSGKSKNSEILRRRSVSAVRTRSDINEKLSKEGANNGDNNNGSSDKEEVFKEPDPPALRSTRSKRTVQKAKESTESILSFSKASSQETVVVTTNSSSKRSASKRASIAVSENLTRKSLRTRRSIVPP